MLRSPAIDHCRIRAAECDQLAALADDHVSKTRYRRLARAWRRLAKDPEFTEKLKLHLASLAGNKS